MSAESQGNNGDRKAEAKLVSGERRNRVGLIRLEDPERRNALSPALMAQLAEALERFDRDEGIACIVLAGSPHCFAAGADVAWLASRDHEAMMEFGAGEWPRIRSRRTPLIAAVSGWALGGGCELALSCDMIVAAESARFGQPEIRLGILPGGGATQRLARIIGRQRTMELVLTGRSLTAEDAHSMGIVNRVVPGESWLDDALELADEEAGRPPHALRLAREAVQAADEMPLSAGLEYERRLFELALSTADREEGMAAFLEKREPAFPSIHPREDGD